MFTFSFGSAFAAQTIDYEAGKTAKVLYIEEAFADKTGEYGITEAYKYNVTKGLQAILDNEATSSDQTVDTKTTTKDDTYNISATNYYAPEKTAAKVAVEKAITDVKAATKAKSVVEILDALKEKLDKLVKTNATLADYKTKAAASTASVDFNDLIADYGADTTTTTQSKYDFYLPGYGKIAKTSITTTATDLKTLATTYGFVIDWFMDKEYRVDFESGVTAMLNALVVVDESYNNAVNKEKNELRNEARTYAKKYNATAYMNTLTVSDLDGINTLLGKVKDFNAKYKGFAGASADVFDVMSVANFKDGLEYLAATYFNQYYGEIVALPASNKLDDTKKADVIALYQKAKALNDSYTKVWAALKAASSTAPQKVESASKWSTLENAYTFYKDADTSNLTALNSKFTAVKGKDFDNSAENVKALEDARKLYDENVKNYKAYNSAVEAKILAAEHNKGAAAGYKEKEDKIDTSKVQAYLNNATVKVTTKALGNTKIRVNARIDATSFNYILGEMSDGCTVSYKFYYKKAGAASYKASKVKDRNYITYTKVSLKKGTKYKFQCEVTIKDVDGKVVATKSYKASTVGSRICR